MNIAASHLMKCMNVIIPVYIEKKLNWTVKNKKMQCCCELKEDEVNSKLTGKMPNIT